MNFRASKEKEMAFFDCNDCWSHSSIEYFLRENSGGNPYDLVPMERFEKKEVEVTLYRN